jgi:hypothetical protein
MHEVLSIHQHPSDPNFAGTDHVFAEIEHLYEMIMHMKGYSDVLDAAQS